jgi:excisionase family DNA binding protein
VPRLVRKEVQEIEPLLLKIPEAARLLNCSERHIDNLAAAGKLEKVHLGDAVRITRASTLKLAGIRTDAE